MHPTQVDVKTGNTVSEGKQKIRRRGPTRKVWYVAYPWFLTKHRWLTNPHPYSRHFFSVSCARMKIKCDTQKPCNQCRHRNVKCCYDPSLSMFGQPKCKSKYHTSESISSWASLMDVRRLQAYFSSRTSSTLVFLSHPSTDMAANGWFDHLLGFFGPNRQKG